MNNIYLVGFMGTGKTAVGKALAKERRRRFVDLDDLIEALEKTAITEIFANKGEAYFRQLEKKVLADIAKEDGLIVACGGGIVIDPDNIRLIKETGRMVCLSASAEVILKRTAKYCHRPLLNVADPKAKIESLLKARAPFYAKADQTIDTSNLSITEVLSQIQ